jgi:hypothetical protein
MDGMGGKGMMYTYQDKSIRMSNEAEGDFEQNSYTFLVDRMIHMRQKSVLNKRGPYCPQRRYCELIRRALSDKKSDLHYSWIHFP